MRKVLPWLALLLVLSVAAGSAALRFYDREPAVNLEPRSVQIQVVNGSGEERLGRAVAEDLEVRGFSVYGAANAESLYSRTTVVDVLDRRCGRARELALMLSVKPRFWRIPLGPRRAMAVAASVDTARSVDYQLKVVLGRDYRRFFPKVLVFR